MSASDEDSFQVLDQLSVDNQTYHFFNLSKLQQGQGAVDQLPYSLKVLLENLLRNEDGRSVKPEHIEAILAWPATRSSSQEIAYRPARVLMQDFTGVPAVVDLAAMRDAVANLGKDPAVINPLSQVDLVIDHSVMVDRFADASAYADNVAIEMERNQERYQFLRWGQSAFNDFRVVPPGTGICHQVNLEYLAKVAWYKEIDGKTYVYPDTLVGTDSHTTMINGLGVLGWGVGGIEAEAAMLGQPVSMLIPEVVGFELSGQLRDGVTATDLVLTVVQMLRQHSVVGKFVEFYGSGLDQLPLADRATIANMAPEYGATCGFFPVDQETLNYLALSGRSEHQIKLVEQYCKAQGLWRDESHPRVYSSSLSLNLDSVMPSVAGPKRPQDRVALPELGKAVTELINLSGRAEPDAVPVAGESYSLNDGDVVIAAITSCTNTSNPAVMLAAGLVAQKALAKGLQRKPWVKTSLAPGSKVVTDYLAKAGVQDALDQLGFNLVGYGCTTCIGNSGPLPDPIEEAIEAGQLTVCSVLSGNRNFEGRIHPKVRGNWLASPPLVVVLALAGTTLLNLDTDAIGENAQGEKIYLRDVWPTNAEIQQAMASVTSDMFSAQYADVFTGDEQWQAIQAEPSKTYPWRHDSTYIQNPPYFTGETQPALSDISGARILALLGDSITTDHISPAGSIAEASPAGRYLKEHGVEKKDFNSYGSRRGNHEVMMRGTFANVRIKNEMCPGVEGGVTRLQPDGDEMSIYDAAMKYLQQNTPLVVIAGSEYGTGSSRDWAAKGTRLLGVKAVIAESFERIHRSNLVGMGVLPLEFPDGVNRKTLQLDGSEQIELAGLAELTIGAPIVLTVVRSDGSRESCELKCRLDTEDEFQYFISGGILHYVLKQLVG
ncbi:MAG: aconitate hydratase AcnA [Pseudomonadales bacterium]|jgi:aconitate hydratase|nr:aconitate hydratase AcnA [Pseudomonadales bacterium]MEC8812320.1 aconitate hydratase AcnA [Pseudomonadota bacterium]TNC87432.1 MAG: aconitate hydratase AcnA [Alcanivorax sp.]HAG92676.1 aconitate hydratase AcnA [Gammaproteobacteria bacterium]HCB40211.1 aconitate hydratase AcnA [Gammaproteobacteria bacterium]|tara:strand:+ start:1624 stop:4284 length:2661 start_codon:yes stop_codon:yes gene_type:complete